MISAVTAFAVNCWMAHVGDWRIHGHGDDQEMDVGDWRMDGHVHADEMIDSFWTSDVGLLSNSPVTEFVGLNCLHAARLTLSWSFAEFEDPGCL